uniref:SET domain-containing protein n=1 Tax=Mycena chlorophos TaxID=658473 RepID=A0ABQ0LD91_MYCCL|nr:predicted protein [Mycena chlorophos]
MKRGFLNSSKGKAAISSDAKPMDKPQIVGERHNTTLSTSMSPIGKVEKVEVPKGFEIKLNGKGRKFEDHAIDSSGSYICTTMPPVRGATTKEPTTECLFVPGTKEIFLNETPGFPRALPPPPTIPTVRVVELPGKGSGLVAARSFKQGDLILTERPLLMLPVGIAVRRPATFTDAQIQQHALNETERYNQVVVERMEEQRRVAFFELHNSHTEDGSGPIHGRARTNGIALANLQPGVLDAASHYSAVGDLISRINHSCSPNTVAEFSRALFAFELFATRDVVQGEELTYHYIDTLVPAAERAELCKPYAFTCTCSACTPPTAESDERRRTIKDFVPYLYSWLLNKSLPDDWVIKRCLAHIQLIEQENLQHSEESVMATNIIMFAYVSLGDAKRASNAAYAEHMFWRMRVDNMPQRVMELMEMLGPVLMQKFEGGQGLGMMQGGGGSNLNK